ncbi:MAG: hypothetical protein FWF99_05750 [Desulfovibrionaceae bacterium]|nr:hypothetical protein [Desulfovibrionaceae bacterium]
MSLKPETGQVKQKNRPRPVLILLRALALLLPVLLIWPDTLQPAQREGEGARLYLRRIPQISSHSGQETITNDGGLLFPLAAGENFQDEEALRLSWKLRLPPSSPIDLEEAPEWLDPDRLWLFISLAVAEPEAYFYAPFAMELTAEEIRSAAAAVLPTKAEVLDQDGLSLPETRYHYPPGETKTDPFSGLDLPVYAGKADILADLPARCLGQTLSLKIDALLCTSTSCSPFRRLYEIILDPATVNTGPPLTRRDLEILRDYRESPFMPSIADLRAASVNYPNRPDAPAPDSLEQEYGLEEYLSRLSPRFPRPDLEARNLGRAMLLGLVAGFVLNFMPCVLPVISLKLGGLAGLGGWDSLSGPEEAARRQRRRIRLYAGWFSLGVIAWFGLILAGMSLAGQIWGQIFQSQVLILALALLLFVMALGLFGMLRLPLLRLEVDRHAPIPRQAFLGGLLATLLATPCSGPLLGGVLAWAVNQPFSHLALSLGSVAAGMASPFLILALRPELGRLLPQSGTWNQVLEKILGFLLLATVLYLLSMLPGDKTLTLLGSFLILSFGAWLRRFCASSPRSRIKTLARFCALPIMLGALVLPFAQRETPVSWNSFEPSVFQAHLGRDNLLLDFTADWCLNCRAMEMTTLAEHRLRAWGKDYQLTCLKVDLTRANPAGEKLLRAMGSASIPFLAIIPASSPHNPTVLRDLVSPAQLDQALLQALGK